MFSIKQKSQIQSENLYSLNKDIKLLSYKKLKRNKKLWEELQYKKNNNNKIIKNIILT